MVLGLVMSAPAAAAPPQAKTSPSLNNSASSSTAAEPLGAPVQTPYLKVLWPMPPAQDPESDRANAMTAAEACKQFGHSFLVGQGLWGTGIFDQVGCFTSIGQKFFAGHEPKSDAAWTVEFTQATDRLIVRLMLAPDKLTNSAAAALVSPTIEAGAVAFPAPPNWQYLMRDEFYSKLVAAAILDTAPASTRLPLPATALRPEDANQLGKTAAPTALQLFIWGVQPETGLWTAHVVGQARIDSGDRVFDWVDRSSITRDITVYAQRRNGPEHGAQALLISIRHRGQTILDGADEPRPGKLPGFTQAASIALINPPPSPAMPAAVTQPPPGAPLALTQPQQQMPAVQPIQPPPVAEAAPIQPIAPPPVEPIQPVAPPPIEPAVIQPPAPVAEPAPLIQPQVDPMAAQQQHQEEQPVQYSWATNKGPRIATSESFVSMRYGIEMIDSATALFSPGSVFTLTGEFHRGWINGLRLYSDILPDHKRDIEGEVFSMTWSRHNVGWAYIYRLNGIIDRIEVIPKLGTWGIKARLPDIDTDGNIITREYNSSGQKNFGIEVNGAIENASYLLRLYHSRDMTFLASKESNGSKRSLQASRTGIELYIKGGPLRFISNNIRGNLLVFDYFEDMTFTETGGTASDLKFVYSTAFAGGGVSLSW